MESNTCGENIANSVPNSQLLYPRVKWCYFSPMNTLKSRLEAMRLKAWTKNAFVFAALLFGKLWTVSALLETLAAALGFGLVSSAVYLMNDTVDRNKDRLHPVKKHRPVASGRLSPAAALTAAGVLASVTMVLSWMWFPWLAFVYTVYLLMQTAYSLKLKNVVILDCILISMGFVLRALAGVAVLHDSGEVIELSPWLVICTFFLALMMAFAKRRHELASMRGEAEHHRKNLKEYSIPMLDQIIGITAGTSILGYSIYTVSDRTAQVVSPWLWVTIPFVAYGVFRYLFIVYSLGLGGSPDKILLKDGPLKVNLLLWLATVAVILLKESGMI